MDEKHTREVDGVRVEESSSGMAADGVEEKTRRTTFLFPIREAEEPGRPLESTKPIQKTVQWNPPRETSARPRRRGKVQRVPYRKPKPVQEPVRETPPVQRKIVRKNTKVAKKPSEQDRMVEAKPKRPWSLFAIWVFIFTLAGIGVTYLTLSNDRGRTTDDGSSFVLNVDDMKFWIGFGLVVAGAAIGYGATSLWVSRRFGSDTALHRAYMGLNHADKVRIKASLPVYITMLYLILVFATLFTVQRGQWNKWVGYTFFGLWGLIFVWLEIDKRSRVVANAFFRELIAQPEKEAKGFQPGDYSARYKGPFEARNSREWLITIAWILSFGTGIAAAVLLSMSNDRGDLPRTDVDQTLFLVAVGLIAIGSIMVYFTTRWWVDHAFETYEELSFNVEGATIDDLVKIRSFWPMMILAVYLCGTVALILVIQNGVWNRFLAAAFAGVLVLLFISMVANRWKRQVFKVYFRSLLRLKVDDRKEGER